jgi:ATP-dependent helicase YprA (DUF1998 family)
LLENGHLHDGMVRGLLCVTATVTQDQDLGKLERERDFGSGKLPILCCSPTMELGIDIRDLYAVHLRNIPPTPAITRRAAGALDRAMHHPRTLVEKVLIVRIALAGEGHDQGQLAAAARAAASISGIRS